MDCVAFKCRINHKNGINFIFFIFLLYSSRQKKQRSIFKNVIKSNVLNMFRENFHPDYDMLPMNIQEFSVKTKGLFKHVSQSV